MDIVILDAKHKPDIVVELKYDRGIPSGHNQPKTMKAGAVFKDLSRLLQFRNAHTRYFLYVTDKEMARYFNNPSNGVTQFFDLAPREIWSFDAIFFSQRPKRFHEGMGLWPAPATLTGLLQEQIARDYCVRLFEIEATQGTAG